MAGYSGKPLITKLGIKDGFAVCIVNQPSNYTQTLGTLPNNVIVTTTLTEQQDFIHFFTKNKNELETIFPKLKKALKPTGMLWISWPKQAAKIDTDLNENVVMKIGLDNGLVDVKVAAIDETWSVLKFVYRLKDR